MDRLVSKDKLCKQFNNWLNEIRDDKFNDWEVEYSSILNCLCAVDDAEEIQVPQWVKTSERKPPKGEEYLCLCSNGYGYYMRLLYYNLKSKGNIYYTEEDYGPDYECFFYDDPEWGFSEMFEGAVLYWLEGLEMPNET